MVHPHAAVVLAAEALREAQQLLGDPTYHVGEDQVAQIVVGAAQPSSNAATKKHKCTDVEMQRD